jgi:cysteine-rich repeat protein
VEVDAGDRVELCANGQDDDGNGDKDCDDAACTGDPACPLELISEQEPNGAFELAPVLTPPFVMRGEMDYPGDVDMVAIDLPFTGEVDFVTYDVTGAPACADTDTYLELFALAGPLAPPYLVGYDDDSGEGACAQLPGEEIPFGPLAPGRYYLQIGSPLRTTTGGYTVYVSYRSVCGDGIVEGGETCDGGEACNPRCVVDLCGNGELDEDEECDDGNVDPGDDCAGCRFNPCGDGLVDEPVEQCDDGNRETGDGCDASCRREPGCGDGRLELPEQCDDGNRAADDCCSATCTAEVGCEVESDEVNIFTTIPGELRAAVWPPSHDVDIFAFSLQAASELTLEVLNATGTGCAGLSTSLALHDLVGEQVVATFDLGDDGCPRLDVSLLAGPYALLVESSTRSFEPIVYRVRVTVVSTCGDGIVEGGEQCEGTDLCQDCRVIPTCGNLIVEGPETCDDGGIEPGDGCDALCQREPACGDGFLDLDRGEQCDDGNIEVDDGCDGACQREPRCGNGFLEAGETCDFGDAAPGDGCSDVCAVEPGHHFEREPNDDGRIAINEDDFVAPAQSFTGDLVVHAALTPAGDEDVFAIYNPEATAVTVSFETAGALDGSCAIDTQLLLKSRSGSRLAFDDDSGAYLCSRLVYAIPAGETVYVQVRDFGDNSTIPAYVLFVDFP